MNKVGIDTAEKLKELGAERAWLEIQKIAESACIHRLLALEGAICGVKKTLLPDERKAELKERSIVVFTADRIVEVETKKNESITTLTDDQSS